MDKLVPSAAIAPTDPQRSLAAIAQNPYFLYLATLGSDDSRRTIGSNLRSAARLLHELEPTLFPDEEPDRFPWFKVDLTVLCALSRHMTAADARTGKPRFAPTTAQGRLTAVKRLLGFARDLGQISEDHLRLISRCPNVKGCRLTSGRRVEPGELRMLFASLDVASPMDARNACLFALLYGAGLRRKEACSVNVDDVELDVPSPAVRVIGKGNKQRRVFLPAGTVRAVAAWLRHRGPAAGPLLWPTDHGKRLVARRMSVQAVAYVVSTVGQRFGLGRHTAHDYRRTFATDLIASNLVDLPTVQHLMGHASPTTTSQYDVRKDEDRAHAAAVLCVPFVDAQEPPKAVNG